MAQLKQGSKHALQRTGWCPPALGGCSAFLSSPSQMLVSSGNTLDQLSGHLVALSS